MVVVVVRMLEVEVEDGFWFSLSVAFEARDIFSRPFFSSHIIMVFLFKAGWPFLTFAEILKSFLLLLLLFLSVTERGPRVRKRRLEPLTFFRLLLETFTN